MGALCVTFRDTCLLGSTRFGFVFAQRTASGRTPAFISNAQRRLGGVSHGCEKQPLARPRVCVQKGKTLRVALRGNLRSARARKPKREP